MTILDTPGGPQLRENLRVQFGGKTTASGVKVSRTSPEFYRALVAYYLRNRKDHEDIWRSMEREYLISRETARNPEALQEVRPSRAYSLVHTVESMVLSNRPKLFLRGFTARRDETVVPVMEDALNNEWKMDSHLVRETRLAIRDCAKYGVGVMLTSYESGEDDNDEDDLTDEERKEQRELAARNPALAAAEAQQKAQRAIQAAAGSPEEGRETFEGDSRVLTGMIVSRRLSPWDLLIDPDAAYLEDAKWVGRVIRAELEAVKSDPSLKNTEDLTAGASSEFSVLLDSRRTYGAGRNKLDSSPFDLVTLFELFIRRPGGKWDMVVLAENSPEILRFEEAPYWMGNPYAILRWNEDGETFFPQSDIQVAVSEIAAERLLLTKVFDGYAREQEDTTFFDENAGINEEQLYAAGDPEVGKWVGVSSPPNGRIQDAFFKLPRDSKSPEALNILAMLERSFQVSSGIGPNQFGQALKSGTSATEAAEVGQFTRARGLHKFAATEEFVARVAYQRLALMAQFYEPEDMAFYVGEEAAEAWAGASWTRGDVQRGLLVTVEPGSTKPVSDDVRVNQILSLLGVANQDPVLRSSLNIPEIFRELFRRLGFHEGSKFLLVQDGQEFGQLAAQVDAAQILAGRQAGARGGVPSAAGAPSQVAQGTAS